MYWACIAFLCLTHGYLLVPNYDDGIFFHQIFNTIRLHNPFYNDFYGQYFHFMKPAILFHALLYSITNQTSFRLIAMVQSAAIFTCACLMYHCARRYASEESSKAGVLVFLYILFAQVYLTPTRPETAVLLSSIAVFWLCERFSDANKTTYLIMASAILFLVAIPMHTNGSIPLIYFVAYILARRHQLSLKSFVTIGAFSIVFAALGFAIIVYPGFSSLAGSLAWFTYDGQRLEHFSLGKGEYLRIRRFVSNYYYLPLLLFIATVSCARLLKGYKDLSLIGCKKYRDVILFLLAVVVGLGFLPSASWEIYNVYYCLPLIMWVAVTLDYYATSSLNEQLKRVLLLATGAVSFWHGYGIMPPLYALLYAGPFVVTAFLVRRMTALQTMAIIVIPMLLFRYAGMISSKIIYERAVQRIKGAPGLVLAHPLFNFSGENVFPVDGYQTQISSDHGTAVVELQPITNVHADLIKAHPLVRFFGSTHNSRKESKWVSRRRLGNEFQLINNDIWKIPEYIAGQVKPLHYSVLQEISLSNPLLDKYADPALKGLKCIVYGR
jgi:hypothetical protein